MLDAITAELAFVGQGSVEIRPLSVFPVPVFEVTAEGFDPSIVLLGPDFYSRALREVLDLQPDQIQYLQVDATRCVEAFRAKDYRLANVLAVGDVIDLPASGYEFGPGLDWNGKLIGASTGKALHPQPFKRHINLSLIGFVLAFQVRKKLRQQDVVLLVVRTLFRPDGFAPHQTFVIQPGVANSLQKHRRVAVGNRDHATSFTAFFASSVRSRLNCSNGISKAGAIV